MGIAVIDVKSRRKVGELPSGAHRHGPNGVRGSADGHRIYVATAGNNAITVLDVGTMTIAATVDAGRTPLWIAVPGNR